jgi:hypothetical protein
LTNWHLANWYLTNWHLANWDLADWHMASWHLADWHLTDWPLTNWHMASWHLANWHMASWHLANWHLTDWPLTDRHLADWHLADAVFGLRNERAHQYLIKSKNIEGSSEQVDRIHKIVIIKIVYYFNLAAAGASTIKLFLVIIYGVFVIRYSVYVYPWQAFPA